MCQIWTSGSSVWKQEDYHIPFCLLNWLAHIGCFELCQKGLLLFHLYSTELLMWSAVCMHELTMLWCNVGQQSKCSRMEAGQTSSDLVCNGTEELCTVCAGLLAPYARFESLASCTYSSFDIFRGCRRDRADLVARRWREDVVRLPLNRPGPLAVDVQLSLRNFHCRFVSVFCKDATCKSTCAPLCDQGSFEIWFQLSHDKFT